MVQTELTYNQVWMSCYGNCPAVQLCTGQIQDDAEGSKACSKVNMGCGNKISLCWLTLVVKSLWCTRVTLKGKYCPTSKHQAGKNQKPIRYLGLLPQIMENCPHSCMSNSVETFGDYSSKVWGSSHARTYWAAGTTSLVPNYWASLAAVW